MRFVDFLSVARPGGETPPPPAKKKSRGSGGPASGKKNEQEVCEQLRRLRYRGEAIGVADPAGTNKSAHDTILTIPGMSPIALELKSSGTPEGGGSNLVYHDGQYDLPKNPILREYYPVGFQPWDGRAPSCFKDDKSSETWEKERNSFKAIYIDVDNTAVSRYYRAKGAHYIHVRGKGVYHTGEDPMGWGVPVFAPHCKIRIRAKQHKGTSVPQDVQASFNFYNNTLEPSPYDFMDLARLPPGFTAE